MTGSVAVCHNTRDIVLFMSPDEVNQSRGLNTLAGLAWFFQDPGKSVLKSEQKSTLRLHDD